MQDMEREQDSLKMQRSDLIKEIGKLKEINDFKLREQADKADQLKNLDYDLSRQQAKKDDLEKFIEAKSYELRNKSHFLEDSGQEGLRFKDQNGRIYSEISALKKQIDGLVSETYDLRKDVEYQGSRNQDMAMQIRDNEMRGKDKEEQSYLIRKELENLKIN